MLKTNVSSYRCKFLSRALAVYCLAQLPESKLSSSSDQVPQTQPQAVRFTPHAPGVAPPRSSSVDLEVSTQSVSTTTPSQLSAVEVRPSAEAVRAMQSLEALLVNKQYTELKGDIEQAIRIIRDSANSLHNALEVCGALVAELYNQRYLHVLTE